MWWEGKITNSDDEIGQATFQAFLNQQAIRWNQAIQGRSSRQWGITNLLYCKSKGLAEEVSWAEQWTANLVNILWQHGLECWRVRNQYLYGNTEEEQEIHLRLDLDTLITDLYDMKEMINPCDSALFLLPRLV